MNERRWGEESRGGAEDGGRENSFEEKPVEKIMIVDDQSDVRILARKRLQRHGGYQTCEFSDAASALEAFERENPDLVLLDVNMPGVDGMEACRIMKERFPDVPILFLTARGDVEDRIRGLELGASDYIPKPFDPGELLARVRAALREAGARKKEKVRAEQEKARAERMEKMAIRDPLTDVFNRRYFEKRIEEEIARAYRYGFDISCMMMDIDNFKSINDRYGHPVGDEVLKKVAAAVKRAVRAVDILARYGGEEFAVILPETDLSEARMIAERVRAAVEKIDLGEEYPRVTVSIGVAAGAFHELVTRADQALYDAKRAGKNRVCVAH
ncbi:MAG: diguanylate cyclase [Candidatus Hydrogenedentota bacterium]|nr:MAG: diguanylate cyclase [Candidatus Hydrogenedentota bacterium]